MRAMVCGSRHNVSAACDALLNLAGWQRSAGTGFAGSYMQATMSSLLSPQIRNAAGSPRLSVGEVISNFSKSLSAEDEELFMWAGRDAPGWVACSQTNGTCYGHVSKRDWYRRDTRGATCNRVFNEQVLNGNVNSSAVGLDVCNLNNRTNELCQILKTAQACFVSASALDVRRMRFVTNSLLCALLCTADDAFEQIKIAQGNCIYVGACAPQLFVYTPGMYSASNNDFVRGTVSDFYEMFKQQSVRDDDLDLSAFSYNTSIDMVDAERVCPLDDHEMALKLRNEALKRGCASVQLDNLKTMLMAVRMVVETLVRINFMILQIILGLFRLLVPGTDTSEVIAEIQAWFILLINVAIQMIEQFVNMMIRMLFEMGEFGRVMKTVVEACCAMLQIILKVWNFTGCKIMTEVLFPIVRGIVGIIISIVRFFKTGDGLVRMLYQLMRYMDRVTCDATINCNLFNNTQQSVEFGALPVASRCWADYVPSLDESDAFSCTRADTCRVSDLNYGTSLDEYGYLTEDGNQIVCDACPLQPGGLINSFGCDVYTKQCTCNRPKIERSYCTSNQVFGAARLVLALTR